jgi:hypothetical protein
VGSSYFGALTVAEDRAKLKYQNIKPMQKGDRLCANTVMNMEKARNGIYSPRITRRIWKATSSGVAFLI